MSCCISTMARLLKCIIILILLVFVYSDGAKPICSLSEDGTKKLVCSPGNYSDFILIRGVVSDNDETTSITLNNCRISDIEYESFNKLPALRYLDLSQNKITRLKLGVLDGFRGLTHLNLSYNYLTTFPLGVFDQKPNLIVLDLSSNRINYIQLGVFDPLHKLEVLDLASNALMGNNIDPYLLDRSHKIKRLNFSKNDMSNAKNNLLHALTELQTLDLEECELEEIPKFISVRSLKTLKGFNLSGNRIKVISNTSFEYLTDLSDLNLSNNRIEVVDDVALKHLKKLRAIGLRNNQLKAIPDTLFQSLEMLINVDLSSNFIEYVPVNAFRNTKVRNLNLSNNKITYLQDNFCLELRNSGALLSKFYFNDNPWQCSCLRDILNEVKKYNVAYNSAKYDGRHPVCFSLQQNENSCHRHKTFSEQIYLAEVSE